VQEEPAGSAAGGGPPNISEKLQLHETLQEKHHRLQQLMQVNRKLRTTFDAKKSKTDELKMQNDELERKLQAREAEESGRARQLLELQVALQGEGATVRKKEAEELQKQASALQEKIEALNEENLALGEKHKDAKSKVADQENSMKMLNRRSQELVRLIELMAGHLNEAQQKAHPGQPLPALRAGAGPQGRAGLVDFTRLPGYDLQKLIGEDAHLNSTGKGGARERKPSGTMSQRSSRPSSSRHSRSGRQSPSPEVQHKRGSSPGNAGRPGSRQSNASRTSSRSGKREGSTQHKEKERQQHTESGGTANSEADASTTENAAAPADSATFGESGSAGDAHLSNITSGNVGAE